MGYKAVGSHLTCICVGPGIPGPCDSLFFSFVVNLTQLRRFHALPTFTNLCSVKVKNGVKPGLLSPKVETEFPPDLVQFRARSTQA